MKRLTYGKGKIKEDFTLTLASKPSQAVQVFHKEQKTDFFSEIGKLAQFEGNPLDLLGRGNMLNKAFFLPKKRKIGRNLIDSNYFSLEEEDYSSFSVVSS